MRDFSILVKYRMKALTRQGIRPMLLPVGSVAHGGVVAVDPVSLWGSDARPSRYEGNPGRHHW